MTGGTGCSPLVTLRVRRVRLDGAAGATPARPPLAAAPAATPTVPRNERRERARGSSISASLSSRHHYGKTRPAVQRPLTLVESRGWRRGLEPPTTGTTTRGSTN